MRRTSQRSKRRAKLEAMELDITSLLDILVILLVFLLKSYSASGLLLNVAEKLELPSSQSKNVNTQGVIVQISLDKIWVDEKAIYDFTAPENFTALEDRSKTSLVPLLNELIQKRKEIQTLEKSTQSATKFSGIVNLIIDKSYRYSFLKKVLNTCAEAGYQQYKFVVLGEE
ncbi:MAG: biopolymer transporter ExbD [Bacteriovoracaceae bacterium]